MIKKTSTNPKVISYSKYESEVAALEMTISNLETSLSLRDETISYVNSQLRTEIVTSEKLRVELEKAFQVAEDLTFKINELENAVLQKHKTIEVLQKDLLNQKAIAASITLHNTELEQELEKLKAKNQRKWYHRLFSKRG